MRVAFIVGTQSWIIRIAVVFADRFGFTPMVAEAVAESRRLIGERSLGGMHDAPTLELSTFQARGNFPMSGYDPMTTFDLATR